MTDMATANRSLHLNSGGDDDGETLYTVTVDSPSGPAALGLIVTGTTVRILAWPDGETAVDVGTATLPID